MTLSIWHLPAASVCQAHTWIPFSPLIKQTRTKQNMSGEGFHVPPFHTPKGQEPTNSCVDPCLNCQSPEKALPLKHLGPNDLGITGLVALTKLAVNGENQKVKTSTLQT